MIYNGLNERDEIFVWLEKAYAERDVRLTLIKVDPKWDRVRSDSRFAAIIKRMGLESSERKAITCAGGISQGGKRV